MNIWYIHPYAGGPGVGRYYRPYFLARHWNLMGHRCTVITSGYHHQLIPEQPRRGRQPHQSVEYRFVPAPRYSGNGLGRVWSMFCFCLGLLPVGLLERVGHGRPDLIVYSSPHPYGFVPGWLLGRLFRAKVFFECRDLWPLSLTEVAGLSSRHPLVILTGWIERFAYRFADRVISLLPAAEPHMREKGLQRDKFLWVPNGIDASDAEAGNEVSDPLLARARALAGQGHSLVIYAGTLGMANDLDLLLGAASVLQRRGVDEIRFLIVGAGVNREALEQAARRDQLSNVEFHEPVPRAVALAVMRQASVGFVAIHRKGLYRFGISPNKLWDYMLSGLPVVAAYASANDPVAEADCGVSCPDGDVAKVAEALASLARLPAAERRLMGERGRAHVLKHYHYAQLAARYIAARDDKCVS